MNNLPDAVRGFLDGLAGEVSESTLRWYAQRLQSFVVYAGDIDPDAVTVPMLRAYRGHLVKRGLSLHSVHGHQRALRRFFGRLYEDGLITRNVARDVPLVRLPPQPPKALTDDDLARLLARLPAEAPRDRAIVLFLADTGYRVGGMCSVTMTGLDLPNRCASVVEKGQKERRVYFTDITADALGTYLAVRPSVETDALFLARDGNGLTENGVRLLLGRLGKRAGVKGRCNAHSFRHAFARSFLRNGGNLAALGRILGHSPGSPVTARYYAVWDDRELQEYHGRYSPLAGVNGNGDKRTNSPPLTEAKDS